MLIGHLYYFLKTCISFLRDINFCFTTMTMRSNFKCPEETMGNDEWKAIEWFIRLRVWLDEEFYNFGLQFNLVNLPLIIFLVAVMKFYIKYCFWEPFEERNTALYWEEYICLWNILGLTSLQPPAAQIISLMLRPMTQLLYITCILCLEYSSILYSLTRLLCLGQICPGTEHFCAFFLCLGHLCPDIQYIYLLDVLFNF